MSIEVAEDNGVGGVEGGDDGVDGERETGGTRRGRRHVNVDDVEVRVEEGGVDGDDFEWRVGRGDGGGVDGGVGDRVVDEGDQSASAATGAVKANNGVVSEIQGARSRREFCFLQTCDEDIVVLKKLAKLDESRSDAVAVELENARRRGRGTGIRMDAGDEKK